MRRFSPFAALLLALAASVPAAATDDDLRSVAGMAQHNRVLLVFAPSMRDGRLEAQRQAMSRFAAGALARDLVIVQVAEGKVIGAHDVDRKLRRRFTTPAPRFRALLIGKDGRVAIDSATPLDEHRLQAAIDAMPMRQEEVRRAKAGEGVARD
ncbi:DUF4174 domain-containing protein [Sphingomonas sp. BIUV-7]|uniref:DUF4174 domain-containing protein n=1 Tax=Sphingomonas natans TaxID=3063330 RepID=A0ABT8Y6Z3_9SPHN|nr:DUF4174 domain-containing protein [Sphingomonas sp. BIUV-7]MDO6413460.1 DUF4174 domain-containing protein [Sphingomonas sp. BIUV-7]